MKKNLITVVILALCIINLILNALIVFTCMPSASKTNKLITEIASVLDLELEKDGDKEKKVDLADLATYALEDKQVVNLKSDSSGEAHFVQAGVSITLDSSAKDYDTVNEKLPTMTGSINNDVRDVLSSYTFTEINDLEIQTNAKKEILKKLQDRFGTECIYGVDFSTFTLQ